MSADSNNNNGTQRVLVTGGSGFLGARVVEAMVLSGFATPVGTIRNWSRAARAKRYPVELVICDILNAEQLDAAMADVDAVVHTAYTDSHESIVGGTRTVAEAALRNGVQKFIHLSSAEVYGPDKTGDVTEDTPTEPSGNAYGDWKIEAESVVGEFQSRGLATTILRPSLIYGPFGGSWSINIAKRLQSGKWGLFDEHGDGIANLVYVDDLVRAIFLSIKSESASGQTFNINGPEKVTWNQYFEQFNSTLGLPALERINPAKSRLRTMLMDKVERAADMVLDRFEDKIMEIYMRGGLAHRVIKMIKGQVDSTPTKGELNDLFARKAHYNDAKIRKLLGFKSAFNLDRGLRLTTEWLVLNELAEAPRASPTDTNARPSDNETASDAQAEAVLS